MKINKIFTIMLPLLLLSGGCAEAQTKDVSTSDSNRAVEAITPNVSVDSNGKLDMEELLAQAQAKRDKSALELSQTSAEAAQTSAEAAALTLLVAIGEGKSEAEISALRDELKLRNTEANKARSLLD